MKKGKFVVIEGADGSGKTTQLNLLSEFFKKEKVPFKAISFPQYSDNPYGKLIKEYLSGKFGPIDEKNIYLMSLAFAGDRNLAKEKIRNWLDQGFLVIADRYVSSNKAHMGAKLKGKERDEFIKWLDNLEYKVNKILQEDLTIFLNVPPVISQKNMFSRGVDILDKDLKYQEKTLEIYLNLAKQKKWIIIQCAKNSQMKSKEEIHLEVVKVLVDKLGLRV